MITKIKRHSRSAVSVVLVLCMLVSCMTVGLIATDAAKVANESTVAAKAQSESVGYGSTGHVVKGSWDGYTEHDITLADGYSVLLAANTYYDFCFKASENSDHFKKDGTITSSVTDYDFPKTATKDAKLKTTIAGYYNFKFKYFTGGEDSMRVDITYPTAATVDDTWTVVGSATGSDDGGVADALFGKSWDPSLTANDMTETSSGSGVYRWTKNNVALTAGTMKYKIAKNHAWDNAYPSNNQSQQVSTAGTYNVTVEYNKNTPSLTMSLTPVANSRLSVQSGIENATVTATYNGTTAAEGGCIDDIPAGASVTINVTPAHSKKCTAVTGTYNTSSTVNASSDSTGKVWTMTMPAADTTVSATIGDVTLKKIYFNNNYTLYGTVFAYVYDKEDGKETNLYLGKKPGKVMIESENSEIWYIEVPENITYVQFISGEGYTTGEMEIPWYNSSNPSTTYHYPKYTAPYGNNEHPTEANGGTWGDYKYGSNNKRTNEYTVSDGRTMAGSNLFTGISATLYDYYVDHEVTDGWLTGIKSDDYNMGKDWKWDPYTKLNSALSEYADNTNQPNYNTTYPLYFGNLAVDAGEETTNNLTKNYYNFNRPANNSQALGDGHANDAVTGLSGKSLGDDDTIHYYSSSDSTNQNGAPMAMFNEDFLSGENKSGDTLATILRTSSFPVRKETFQTIVFDPNGKVSETVKMHYWKDSNNSDNGDATGSVVNGLYYFTLPAGYDRIAFFTGNWDKKTGNLTVDFSKTKYTVDSVNDNTIQVSKSAVSVSTHTYYEYDSTDGKDNAFITDIDTTNKTAKIDYYNNSSGKFVQSNSGTKGFFPFDYNNIVNERGTIYFDASACTGGTSYWAHFYTGNDTKDVKMEKIGNSDIYKVGVPGNYQKVIFTKNSDNNAPSGDWGNGNNVYNYTEKETGLTVPAIGATNVMYKTTGYDGYDRQKMNGYWTTYSGTVSGNGYADATNHYAHDQGFGMKLEVLFNLNNNGLNDDGTPQTFDFSGDDDLWVYIDGKLALDLGGAHGKTTGSINFNTMTATANNSQSIASGITRNGSISSIVDTSAADFNPNYVHTMTIYYMERGMFDSNLKFGFSFHAVPNMFWIDKKIRTKDKYDLGYDTINSGFFINNNQSDTDSNMTTYNGKSMSKFEASFQNEQFTVEQKRNSTLIDGSSYSYTMDNDPVSHEPTNGQYPIKHDLGNCFVGKFTKNDNFSLKEIIGSNNKYVYQSVFSVWDQANNDQTITPGGNASDGYTFTFAPTTAVTSGIDMLNLKARFDNYMVAHNLRLTKEITNVDDTDTNFTFQIKFDFTGTDVNPNFVAYPLYCDVDGVRRQLDGEGKITVTAGQIVEIEEIPEKAKIQIVEVLTDSITGYRYGGITLTKGGTAVNPTSTVTKGVVFTMGDNDMTATVTNRKPDFGYTLKYTYPAYVSTYGNQSYTVKGVFTESEKNTYLQLDGSGNPVFQSDALKRTFINTKAPYEDNFQQTLSFADSPISDTGTGLGWSNDVYTCEITAQPTTDNKINVRFNLPYAVNGSLVPQESGETGKVAYTTAAAVGSKDIDCFDWYVTAGRSKETKTGDAPVFVNAPLIVYTDVNNDATKQYFQYWKVSTQSGYGMSSAEYTRCYDYQFDFALFTDCEIEPVYNTTWPQSTGNPNPPTTYNMYERYDPELQITDLNYKGISIAFLENSRNQYNSGDCGGRTVSTTAADVIYSDFLLNFNYVAGLQKLKNLPAGQKKAGLVVEAVDYIDYEKDKDNNPIVGAYDTDKDYSNESSFTSNASAKATAITNWLQGSDDKPAGCAKSEFDVHGKLDNKNCIQYYYALNNRAFSEANGGQLLNTMQNRYKVFRAYAYIGNVSDSTLANVQLSAPVYFTIYDAASQGLADNDTRPTS